MSSYSSSKSTRALAADFLGFFPHDSVTLTYPLVTVTTRQQDLSLQVGAPAILVVMTIAAICFIFLVKRIVDHRRHVLMEAADNRTLGSDIPEIGLQTVPTYGQYLNSLRMDGCSQTSPSQQTTVPPRPDITVDMPPSYDMATKYSILNTASPCGFANTGYAASESRLVLPPSYLEATKNLSLAPKDIASDLITVEQSVRSSDCATHDEQTTSISHDSQASIVEVRIQGTLS